MLHLAKRDNSCAPTSHKYTLLNNIDDSTRRELGDALYKAVNCRKSTVAKVKKRRFVLIGDSHIKRYPEKFLTY